MENQIPLEITDLSIHAGKRQLFSKVNLAIQPGEFVSLMGENGVGKTTLLETLLGYRQPTSGNISFWGMNLNDTSSAHLLSRIGYVTSTPERYPLGSTISDLFQSLEVIYPTWNHELSQFLLEGFKLRANQSLNGMSLGENTKVRLIKALAFEPDLLLLDELTANLSPNSRKTMLSALFDLFNKKKVAVLYVCHSPEESVSLSDRIVVLSAQGLKERG